MKKFELTLYKGTKKSLIEINQNLSIHFAFVNANGEQIHQPGKCRDFLGDIPWSKKFDLPVSIYNMSYYHDENPYDETCLRLSMKFPSVESIKKFMEHFHYINQMEEFAGTQLSKFIPTTKKDTLIIEADPVWQSQTWKLSLYTFYLKCCSYDDPQNPSSGTVESRYAETYSPYEERVLKQVNNPEDLMRDDLYTNHNASGFISMIKNQNKTFMKMIGE